MKSRELIQNEYADDTNYCHLKVHNQDNKHWCLFSKLAAKMGAHIHT